jgi:hypothetical protein
MLKDSSLIKLFALFRVRGYFIEHRSYHHAYKVGLCCLIVEIHNHKTNKKLISKKSIKK